MFMLISLLAASTFLPCILGQCLTPDSKPPKCEEWVAPDNGDPVFIEHQYNCSRFWVCQPDLSECLHECASAGPNSTLYFDVRYQHPLGPVCDWPANIDCKPKPEECKKCEVWQDCVETGNGYICIPDCHIDPHCDDDEYCDFPDGGDGNCHEGCRNGASCGSNVHPCGTCVNHACEEPSCCTDDDCPKNQVCNNGTCEFQCLTDDDCEPDEYCENGECLKGCNEDSDCSDTSCSTCGTDHQCINPQCCSDDDCNSNEYCDNGECKDGCNEDSDCTANGLECAVCGADNQCTQPECCTDDDCSASKPICTEDNICADGCRDDTMCPGFDAVCNQDYSNCNYCNKTVDTNYGDCEPGCLNDDNCDGTQQCNGMHQCSQPGSTKNLKQIILKTQSCKGCQSSKQEDGPVFHIEGESGVSGPTSCNTLKLDHADSIDFTAGHLAIFEGEDDKDVLGTCFRANLQGGVTGGMVAWTATQGEWSLEGNKVDFTWSDQEACKYSCCLDNKVLSAANPMAKLTKCQKNCLDNLTC